MVYYEVECRFVKNGVRRKEYLYASSKFYYQKLVELERRLISQGVVSISFHTKTVHDEEVIEFIDNFEFTIFEQPILDSRYLLTHKAS